MDFGTTIIGVVIILLCILPFVIKAINSKRKEQQLLNNLFSIAKEKNCAITEHSVWNNSAIGIDNTNKALFFINTKNNYNKHILLQEASKCRVVNTNRIVGTGSNSSKVIDKLELMITLKNKSEVVIEFYNTEHDSLSLTSEIQLMEKWNAIINKNIA